MKCYNAHGLSFTFLDNGSISCIDMDPIRISLKPASLFSYAGSNIYLRKYKPSISSLPLLGPTSNSSFTINNNQFIAKGEWDGIGYECRLRISGKSCTWQWNIALTNHSKEPVELDLILVQDVGLKSITSGLINEYYVSQYLERRIFDDPIKGPVICCRQNMKEPTGHPWLMIACDNGAVAASTDGMDFYGKSYRQTGIPEGLYRDKLPGESAGESSVVALQERLFTLAENGGQHQSRFYATALRDHPAATAVEDLTLLQGLQAEFEEVSPSAHTAVFQLPSTNLFSKAPFLNVEDLNDEELERFFGKVKRHVESDGSHLLSFFTENGNHVMMRRKEVLVDRPQAHILQAQCGFTPDDNILSATAFAFGNFISHLCQGNTNFNVLLSVCTSQFNLEPETGQRIFVEWEGKQYLLGIPSAFETGLNHCRWIYKTAGHCFQVRSWTSKTSPMIMMDFNVLTGGKVNLLITHDFDRLNGWKIITGEHEREFIAVPDSASMIETRYPGAHYRFVIQSPHTAIETGGEELLTKDSGVTGTSLFVIAIQNSGHFCISITGGLTCPPDAGKIEDSDLQFKSDTLAAKTFWDQLSLNLIINSDQRDIAAIREILPWYGMNALTHYLTPYGLEQFSGAAWGTRDISQGPVDLLLSTEKYKAARQILKIIFSNQHSDGSWPQWWMFDRYSEIRADNAHGDVIYWCILALSNYLLITGDYAFMNVSLPFYRENPQKPEETMPLREHVRRVIDLITDSFLPGTALVPFGGGDWNDSLQPVSKDLARRMISSWTVEMNYQAFVQYGKVSRLMGDDSTADCLEESSRRIRGDFNKYLVKDGLVAGYGMVEEDGKIRHLLHPSDQTTGISYSLLPMNRGIISGLFTKDQALRHVEVIEKHLKGPDGARLMDRPLRYHGGIQQIFQRAESSTFFGREIGLMYVHEHIRYAEVQAIMGNAEDFVKALRQANPVAYREIVTCGDYRQSNCYYSSSDVTFKNRYEADEKYGEILTGNLLLKGGWRVYSSGPGIYIGLIINRLFGLRRKAGWLILDPVLPLSLDGFTTSLKLMGRKVIFHYSVKERTFSPLKITINGEPIIFNLEENPYRTGGALISMDHFLSLTTKEENNIEIIL